jgi:hypothetical protein
MEFLAFETVIEIDTGVGAVLREHVPEAIPPVLQSPARIVERQPR